MIRILAVICGESECPACGSHALKSHEAGYYICKACGAVVDYAEGRWGYAGEGASRELPGVMGKLSRGRAA